MYVENENNGFHCQKGKEKENEFHILYKLIVFLKKNYRLIVMFTYFKTILKIIFLKANFNRLRNHRMYAWFC